MIRSPDVAVVVLVGLSFRRPKASSVIGADTSERRKGKHRIPHRPRVGVSRVVPSYGLLIEGMFDTV